MEPFTLNRKFLQQEIIDTFHSIIWTERYYGDSEVELVVPLSMESLEKLRIGTFLGISESDEVMILENMTIEEEKIKFTGMSLLPWLNNRFIRSSNKHQDKNWLIVASGPPGWALWAIIYYMCVAGSPFLNGTYPTGISNPERLAIPGLGLKDYDKSGKPIDISVPFGPVYNIMRSEIAEPLEIGMQITLEWATDTEYFLGFRSYKGVDRTSSQNVNPIVRFSPQMESLTKIKELQSIAALKTLVYTFAENSDSIAEGITPPGSASLTGSQYTGFDLRALQVITNDVTIDTEDPPTEAELLDLLNKKAAVTLTENLAIAVVDGEIVPGVQFQYGRDFNLGDIIEVQGNSGVISTFRVTEYIRSQDEAGEKSYPTMTALN